MKHLDELKESMKIELEKYGKQGLSAGNFSKIRELLAAYKDACKIEMMESESKGGYSEARGGHYMHGSSYDDDMMYSERKGRGGNTHRDNMGRYSSEGGSYERGGQGDYSRDEFTDWMMREFGYMMEGADPKQREILKKCMRDLERD